MDFIERLFHFSPDGGNGATEACWLACALLVGFGVAFVRSRKTSEKSG